MKKYVRRSLLVLVTGVTLYVGYAAYRSSFPEEEVVPAVVVGVQHLGPDHLISEFYVNKYGGTGVGREGGGGGEICCIVIPSKWRPGLIVEVRWKVEGWPSENRKEVDAGKFESVTTRGMYIAKVPLEKYENERSGDVYVHFFPKGRVRVVSTLYSVLSTAHPVRYGPVDRDLMATAGWPIKEMFTQAELDEADRRRNKWQ
ncbi:DUF3304 domain-containing protein [Duganella violaceipulchra]|uniref:DUF3304 domain-containing protein n=1 Tax=Duganella violaceipulchra TaxID=2849652 RepID=A0AA41HAZ1_9BURK|nr:DUF3304 domain-containing protein [Duganella violaceicalia]MBV6325237.1 DUF3304 domain-containing protein [Duganella violaceicalia]MCP2012451.1 hypothetical protein [Duganella violaceicalia]